MPKRVTRSSAVASDFVGEDAVAVTQNAQNGKPEKGKGKKATVGKGLDTTETNVAEVSNKVTNDGEPLDEFDKMVAGFKKKPRKIGTRSTKVHYKSNFKNAEDDPIKIDTSAEDSTGIPTTKKDCSNVLDEIDKLLDGSSEQDSITLKALKHIVRSSTENKKDGVGNKDICYEQEGGVVNEDANVEEEGGGNGEDIFSNNNEKEDNPDGKENSISDVNLKTTPQGNIPSEGNLDQASSSKKRGRGPTKCKSALIEKFEKIPVQFNAFGQPIGEGSVKLSSFLGPLVREIVPYTIEDWRKAPESMKNLLWAAVQEKYDLDQEWQKDVVLKEMGELWRASKSRLVTKLRNAKNVQEQMELQPNNIKSIDDWKQFIKLKTSERFKAKSNKFREMRSMQFAHTTSRQGYARLTEDMKIGSDDPSKIRRKNVWIKAHTKKNGEPVNTTVAETIAKINDVEEDETITYSSSFKDDALSKVLGPDKRGRVRALGKGVTLTKLQIVQQNQAHNDQMQANMKHLEDKVASLTQLVSSLMSNQGQMQQTQQPIPNQPTVDECDERNPKIKKKDHNRASQETSSQVHSATSVNTSRLNKPCKLLDWSRNTREIVAEGRWSTNDPDAVVHHIPLGPNAVRVWVDVVFNEAVYLWRTTSALLLIGDAVGTTTAWPADKVLLC